MNTENLRKKVRAFLGTGIKQVELAGLSGIPQPTISDFVSGKQASVSFETGMKLLSAIEKSTPTIQTNTPEIAEGSDD